MPVNPYFPAGYQPIQNYYNPYQYNQQQQPQNQQQQNPTGGIIWVQGEAGAKSYLVAPNTTVQLWDSENQTIYLKSADASGMPSIKILDYTIRDIQQNTSHSAAEQPKIDFATKEEVTALQDQITALQGKIKALTKKGADNE